MVICCVYMLIFTADFLPSKWTTADVEKICMKAFLLLFFIRTILLSFKFEKIRFNKEKDKYWYGNSSGRMEQVAK